MIAIVFAIASCSYFSKAMDAPQLTPYFLFSGLIAIVAMLCVIAGYLHGTFEMRQGKSSGDEKKSAEIAPAPEEERQSASA